MRLHAKPNLNGNTVEHFQDAYNQLTAAERAINTARTAMMSNVMHGRNYQHTDYDIGADERDMVLSLFSKMDDAMRSLKSGLIAALIEDDAA